MISTTFFSMKRKQWRMHRRFTHARFAIQHQPNLIRLRHRSSSLSRDDLGTNSAMLVTCSCMVKHLGQFLVWSKGGFQFHVSVDMLISLVSSPSRWTSRLSTNTSWRENNLMIENLKKESRSHRLIDIDIEEWNRETFFPMPSMLWAMGHDPRVMLISDSKLLASNKPQHNYNCVGGFLMLQKPPFQGLFWALSHLGVQEARLKRVFGIQLSAILGISIPFSNPMDPLNFVLCSMQYTVWSFSFCLKANPGCFCGFSIGILFFQIAILYLVKSTEYGPGLCWG